MTAGPLQITAEEVNCLIYSYFQDSGLKHSAFTILHEGQLQRSPYLAKHIPRGELIQLLGKALLYLEVESHWRSDHLTNSCQAGFSLLEPHVCSSTVDAEAPPPPVVYKPVTLAQALRPQQPPKETVIPASQRVVAAPTDNKRKVSPTPSTGPQEKRPRMEDQMDVDQQPGANPKPAPAPEPHAVIKKVKSGTRAQGPGDDRTDPRAILLLPGHKSEVFVCAWNPVHHEVLGTGSKDAVVNIWDLPKPSPRIDAFTTTALPPITLPNLSKATQADLTALHWSPDGNLLAIGSYDSVFRICTRKGSMYFTHPLHEGPIFAVRFSKSGRWVLTASLDGTAAVWDVNERKPHRQYHVHGDCCLDIDWLTDDTFASAGADKRIFIMNIFHDEPIKVLEGHQDEINQIRANPSGTRLASCSDDTNARIWRVDKVTADPGFEIPGLAGDEVVVLEGHQHSVSTVAWCPYTPPGAHEIIATSSFDHTARVWDSVTGQCLHVFTDHRRPVYAMSWSPDGQFLATGSGDGWFFVYSAKNYERKWAWFAGPDKPGVFEIDWQIEVGVNRVALALEGRQVAIVDVSKLSALNTTEYQNAILATQSSSSS